MRSLIAIIVLLGSLFSLKSAAAGTELTLENAQRLTQEHSLGVAGASYDSLSASADYSAAQAGRFPTLSLNAMSYYLSDIPTAKLGLTTMELGVHENYQADFKLTMPLYAGGRITSQIRAQQAIAQSRGASLEAKRLEIAYTTRRAYLGMMAAEALSASASASLERIELIRKDVDNLYSQGMADSSNILEAELALEKARQAYSERQTSKQNSGLLMNRLTGLKDDFVAVDNLPTPDLALYPKSGLGNEIIARPELKALETRAQAAKFQIGLNKAGYLPALSGYGGYSYGKPNKDTFNKTWNDYWTTGLNLTWEFNLGGKSFKNVSSARYAAKSVLAARDDLEESLILQANIALENLRQAYENYTTSGRQYDIAQRQYRIGQEKQKAGSISLNRLLELEADLASIEQLYKASRINYFLSETEYLYAIGSPRIYGGF
jgi:outer membrane protein